MGNANLHTDNGDADFVRVPRTEYDALRERIEDLEDILAADAAAADEALPEAFALRIINGENPVRVWREYRGFTIRGLAEAAHLSRSYLSEIENGQKPGSVEAYKALARTLDVSIDALVMD